MGYGLFVCGLIYLVGLLTLGSHTEAYNREQFGGIFSERVVNSSLFEAINGHFVAVGGALGFDQDNLERERTPEGWERVEAKNYSYAVPEDWSTKSNRDLDTYAEGPGSDYRIVGVRAPRNGSSLRGMKMKVRADVEAKGAKHGLDLSPFTVPTEDDSAKSGKVSASVYSLKRTIYYVAVVDIGGDEVLVFTISSTEPDQVAMRKFCDRVMDTFVVKG